MGRREIVLRPRRSRPGRRSSAVLLVAAASACSPPLDWREVRPEKSGAAQLFPCRPERNERVVGVAGAVAPMRMLSCAAGGSTYALGYLELDDPAAVTPALIALRTRASANIDGRSTVVAAAPMAGATPNREAARVGIAGRLPDGTAVVEHALFFARGLTVYQASVIGNAPDGAAVDAFFSSLKLGP